MKTRLLFPGCMMFCALIGLFFSALLVPLGAQNIPMGPVGGTCRVVPGTGLLEVVSVTVGGPGELAGLQAGDFIRATDGLAFGETSTNSGDGYVGAIQDFAMALDRAEGGSGSITLNVTRTGVGGTDLVVNVGTAGSLGPAWPAGGGKADLVYEECVAEIHSKVQASSDGNFGYNSGWFGMILLSHPNWTDTGGATPYRLSIDKLRTRCENYINGRTLHPAEPYFWNGSDVVENPTYAAQQAAVNFGLENWDICSSAIFLALYRTKSGDATADTVVQTAAEAIAYRIQHWLQYDDPPDPHVGPAGRIGRMGHGGVSGDYSHYNGVGALNIINAHALPALALLKNAGADVLTPLDPSINEFSYNPGLAVPSIEEKFRICWDSVKSATRTDGLGDDGNVGYVGVQSGWDSSGRTPGSFAGWNLYGMTANADDTDKAARQADYVARRWYRQQHAHAYTLGGVVLSQLAMPFLDDRPERFFQENTRLFPILARQPDGSVDYFPGRQNNGGDSYLNYERVGLINAGMPGAIRSGNLPGFAAPSATRIHARMNSPINSWPALEARQATLTGGLNHSLDLDITDADGAVLSPAGYTATWTHVSGPGTTGFGSPNSEDTTVSFPSAGTYRVELEVVAGGYTLTEPYDLVVITDPPPTGLAPYVVTDPSPQTVDQGDTVSFTVDVQGTEPMVYQWRLNGVNIGSATVDPQFTIDSVAAGSAGDYDCVITNAHGTVTSATATLTINGVGGFQWGGLWRDVFTGIGGSSVSNLTGNSNYPNFPDASGVITNAESPTDYANDYGQRWSGWITPPETGSYRFYMASADHAELWISTDDTRANRQLRAVETYYRGERNWPSSTSDESVTPALSLVAGQRYYIELLHKEGGGGDNAAVTWDWVSPATWATPVDGSVPLPGAVLEYQVGGTLNDTVTPPADYPPLADDQSVLIYGGAATAITLTGEDFENATLSFNITANPAKGVLGGTAPNLTYTPNGGASGTDSFKFTTNDGGQDSLEATVTISLIPESGGDLKVWDGSTDNLWSDGTNWLGDNVPDANDAVIFDSNSISNLATSLNGDKSIGRLVVEDPAGAVTVADNTLTIADGIEMRPATQDVTISSAVALGATQEWSVGSGRRLAVSGAISGSPAIVKTGDGVLSFEAWSSFTGGVTVEEGTVELNKGSWYDGYAGGPGAVTVHTGATAINMLSHAFGSGTGPSRDIVLLGGRFRLKKETYVDDIWMTAGTIDNTSGSTSNIRARSGSGTVVTVNAAAGTSVIDCEFSMVGSAIFDINDGAADPDLLVSGNLSGGSTLTKNGAGRMMVSGSCTHDGAMNITAGSVAVTGSLAEDSTVTVQSGAVLEGTGNIQGFVSSGGTVSPGLGGVAVLSIDTFEQLAGGAIEIELGGVTAGSGYDQVAVTRSATLAGDINVTLVPGFVPEAGDSFIVVSSGSRVGTFTSINLPALPSDREWVTSYDPGVSGLAISVDPIPPFEQWQGVEFGGDAGNPVIAGETADPDVDFIPNLLEYALNLDPNAHPPGDAGTAYEGLPAIGHDGPGISIIYRKNLSATDVTYTVEESDDIGVTDPWVSASVSEVILSDDGQTQVIKATVPLDHLPKFVRLKVTK